MNIEHSNKTFDRIFVINYQKNSISTKYQILGKNKNPNKLMQSRIIQFDWDMRYHISQWKISRSYV